MVWIPDTAAIVKVREHDNFVQLRQAVMATLLKDTVKETKELLGFGNCFQNVGSPGEVTGNGDTKQLKAVNKLQRFVKQFDDQPKRMFLSGNNHGLHFR